MGLRKIIDESEADAMAARLAAAIVALCEAQGTGADPAEVFLAAFDALPGQAGASSAPDWPAEQETAGECAADLMRAEL